MKEVRAYTRLYFLPFFGKMSIRDIREAHIEDFKNQLPEHLSPKTVYNILGVFRKLMHDAYRRRDILSMPTFPKIPLNEPHTRFLWPEEQEKILAQVKDPVYRTFYLFLMMQGCRPGEARALRWENIDLKNDIVVIRAAFDRGVYRPHTKERDVRVLPLHPNVKQALLKLPRSLAGFVFVNRFGRPLSSYRVDEIWRQAARASGVKATCYEGTRHSFASQAINRGVSQRQVGAFLRHKWDSSTRRYAKVVADSLRGFWGDYLPNDYPQSIPGNKDSSTK
jgi:integrase